MKKFNSETGRNEFKDLCIKVLPLIENIEHVIKKAEVEDGVSIRIGNNGYLSMDISNSKWRLARYEKDTPIKIMYEHSEEISAPGSKRLDKISENLVEISLVFADMQITHSSLCGIDSTTWKEQFVEWANEFESKWDDSLDYPEEIDRFARKKIAEYAGLEVA